MMRCVIEGRNGHTVCNSIFIHNNRYKIETFSTLVCPNLYSSWLTSMDPKSFSAAFLLSMNWPSGITLAFSTLYLLSIIKKKHYFSHLKHEVCIIRCCMFTSAWSQHTWFCLGNPFYRFWYPPVHHYTWAGGWPGSSAYNLWKYRDVKFSSKYKVLNNGHVLIY